MRRWQHDETGRITESASSPGPRWVEIPSVVSMDGAGQEDMQSLPFCFTCHGTGTHPDGDECFCDSGLRPEEGAK